MKKTVICLLTHEYPPMPGGVGVSCQRIGKLLSQNGFDVHISILKKHHCPVLVGENITSFKDGEVTIHEILFSQDISKKDEQKAITVSELGFLNYKVNIDALLSMQLLHKKFKFEALNALFLTHVSMLATLVAKLENIPLMVSIRGNDIGKNIFSPHFLPQLQYVLSNADVVTSVSTDLLKVAKTICPLKKSFVVNNSFDWSRLNNFKTPEKKYEGIVIGSVGIFRYKKGIPQLLKALENVRFPNDNWKLLLVGDYLSEEEKQYHQHFLDSCHFSSRIHITGMVDPNKVFEYLAEMDIFVAPSLFSEGCPNTVLEAMAMKKAIIASDAGAIPEIIQHEKTGIIYHQADISELTHHLQLLIDEPSLRKKLGDEAHSKLKGINQDNEWHGWNKAFNSLLENN